MCMISLLFIFQREKIMMESWLSKAIVEYFHVVLKHSAAANALKPKKPEIFVTRIISEVFEVFDDLLISKICATFPNQVVSKQSVFENDRSRDLSTLSHHEKVQFCVCCIVAMVIPPRLSEYCTALDFVQV